MDPMETKPAVAVRVEKAVAGKSLIVRWLIGLIHWLFPVVLLVIGYIIAMFVPAFNTSVFRSATIDPAVWPPLFVLIILAIVWLLFDLFWVFSRETTSRSLQVYNTVSVFLAIVFSVGLGCLINSQTGITWWFVVPFCTAAIDAFTTGWAAINNATQKPFMTERGRE
ncbi:MAG: hypothetical protein ACLQPD_21800 [Desulfomonilaceae bacterium]